MPMRTCRGCIYATKDHPYAITPGPTLPRRRRSMCMSCYIWDDPDDIREHYQHPHHQLQDLMDRHSGWWGQHPDYPRSDWVDAVRAADTNHGYWDWVLSQTEGG